MGTRSLYDPSFSDLYLLFIYLIIQQILLDIYVGRRPQVVWWELGLQQWVKTQPALQKSVVHLERWAFLKGADRASELWRKKPQVGAYRGLSFSRGWGGTAPRRLLWRRDLSYGGCRGINAGNGGDEGEREDRESDPRWTDQQARRETGQVRGKLRKELRTWSGFEPGSAFRGALVVQPLQAEDDTSLVGLLRGLNETAAVGTRHAGGTPNSSIPAVIMKQL